MITISSDGFGGCCSQLSFCDIYHAFFPTETIEAHFICSEPVKQLIKEFAPNFINLKFHNDSADDLALCHKLSKDSARVYNLTPDRMGRAPYFRLPQKITWAAVKRNQFLYKTFPPPENKRVFLSLLTAQDNNSYGYNKELIETLCFDYPTYNFYFSNVKNWSHKNIEIDCDLRSIISVYSNFIVYEPENIVEDFKYLANKISYFIGIDSGVLNFAWVLGRERILIDSRYNSLAFRGRWRQTESDLIPADTSPKEISRLFGLTVKNSELNGVGKHFLLGLSNEHIEQAMLYKDNEGL